MVARAMCVMYYGRSCARTGNEAGHCTETEQKLPFRCTNGTWKLFYDLYRISIKGIEMHLAVHAIIYDGST